jgi:hypothetical protein
MGEDIRLVACFGGTDDDPEALEQLTAAVIDDLRALDLAGDAERVRGAPPPDGAKSVGTFLAGVVKTFVTTSSVRSFLQTLWQRLAGRQLSLSLSAGDRHLELKVNSESELKSAVALAAQFVTSTSA